MTAKHEALAQYIANNPVGKVMDFDPLTDSLLPMDFTAANTALTDEILDDTTAFSDYINAQLLKHTARYGIGGYDEHRTIYSRSTHFDGDHTTEPRRLHLGIDIWGPAGAPVYSFEDATVAGLGNNTNFGDYGGTIILKYDLDGLILFGLYGHLSAASVGNLSVGQQLSSGEKFAELGIKEENGYWPPHLHFQLIFDMEGNTSDYPGVCRFTERNRYLSNCPDPMPILTKGMLQQS